MATESTPATRPSVEPNPETPDRRLKNVLAGRPATATFEELFGRGRDLWADDAAFEQFLRTIEAARAEKG